MSFISQLAIRSKFFVEIRQQDSKYLSDSPRSNGFRDTDQYQNRIISFPPHSVSSQKIPSRLIQSTFFSYPAHRQTHNTVANCRHRIRITSPTVWDNNTRIPNNCQRLWIWRASPVVWWHPQFLLDDRPALRQSRVSDVYGHAGSDAVNTHRLNSSRPAAGNYSRPTCHKVSKHVGLRVKLGKTVL